MAADAAPNVYDAVPYPSFALPQTHPDRLATLATLFGMRPAPLDQCRVLELGCGDGANLIPMALTLPGSRFVGIDLAARPIARGNAMAAALRLGNIALHHADIQDVSGRLGEFDYIIAHGLYSWVPPPIQEQILAICATHLRPNGVAYVSYNTYPGGRYREITRALMDFHTRGITAPQEKVAKAREIVRFVADAQPGDDPYAMILRAQQERVAGLADASIYHDYLADVNTPVYFHEFVRRAADHGLQYLAEADFFDMQGHGFSASVVQALNDLGADDLIATEQYLDFLRGRAFRQTLLCHRHVSLERSVPPDRAMDLYVASSVQTTAPAAELGSEAPEEFRGSTGAVMATNHPVSKAALRELGVQWPQALHFLALLARARSRIGAGSGILGANVDEDARVLGGVLVGAYAAGLIELHAHPLPFVRDVSAKPLASPLARWQLRDGTIVTNLRHTSVRMDDQRGRDLLGLLDGTRDHAALLEARAGDGGGDSARQELERDLARMADLALLMA
jgi:SAM-dependent methyltransferase